MNPIELPRCVPPPDCEWVLSLGRPTMAAIVAAQPETQLLASLFSDRPLTVSALRRAGMRTVGDVPDVNALLDLKGFGQTRAKAVRERVDEFLASNPDGPPVESVPVAALEMAHKAGMAFLTACGNKETGRGTLFPLEVGECKTGRYLVLPARTDGSSPGVIVARLTKLKGIYKLWHTRTPRSPRWACGAFRSCTELEVQP